MNFEEFFNDDHVDRMEVWAFSETLMKMLYKRAEKGEWELWPKPVKVYYACSELNWQVGNGGFAQAAYNVPHLFEWAAEGYEILGLRQYASLIGCAQLALSEEKRLHEQKGLAESPTLADVFEHFSESEMARFDNVTEEADWWFGENLNDHARRHAQDFIGIDVSG